jgi:hypothetical protein
MKRDARTNARRTSNRGGKINSFAKRKAKEARGKYQLTTRRSRSLVIFQPKGVRRQRSS